MTQAAADALERARDELLRKQRECSWCNARFPSWQELVSHITMNHWKKDEDETA